MGATYAIFLDSEYVSASKNDVNILSNSVLMFGPTILLKNQWDIICIRTCIQLKCLVKTCILISDKLLIL